MRSLVPLDTQTILGSVARTHRLFTVEENPRLCGWGAEIVSIVADEAFYDLDGPPVRITTPHIPLPAADILEDIALPTRRSHRRAGEAFAAIMLVMPGASTRCIRSCGSRSQWIPGSSPAMRGQGRQ